MPSLQRKHSGIRYLVKIFDSGNLLCYFFSVFLSGTTFLDRTCVVPNDLYPFCFQFIFSTALDGKIKAWLYDNLGSRVDYDAPGRWCTTMAYSADGTRLIQLTCFVYASLFGCC